MPFEPSQRRQGYALRNQRQFEKKKAEYNSDSVNGRVYRQQRRQLERATRKSALKLTKSKTHQVISADQNPTIRHHQHKLQRKHHNNYPKGLSPLLFKALLKWGIPMLVAWMVVEGFLPQGVQAARPTERRNKGKKIDSSLDSISPHNQTRVAPPVTSNVDHAPPSTTTSAIHHLAESVYVAIQGRFAYVPHQAQESQNYIEGIEEILREDLGLTEQLRQIKDDEALVAKMVEVLEQHTTAVSDRLRTFFHEIIAKVSQEKSTDFTADSSSYPSRSSVENNINNRDILPQLRSKVDKKQLQNTKPEIDLESSSQQTIINVSELDGSNGFRIEDGLPNQQRYKWIVSSAGDFNGDKISDMMIASNAGERVTYPVYVVYGRAGGFASPISLQQLNKSTGFRVDIDGRYIYGERISIGGAGDVNKDGFADILIGVPGYGPDKVLRAGSVFLIYGRAEGFASPISTSFPGLDPSIGIRIDGEMKDSFLGRSVDGADFNGDGISDMLLAGASFSGYDTVNHYINYTNYAYVVYGRVGKFTSTIKLSELDETTGFKMEAEEILHSSSQNSLISNGGDVNGDGVADIIFGVPLARPNDLYHAGLVYVVYGHVGKFTSPLILSELDEATGFRINGEVTNQYLGLSVSGLGDINGDGFADIIIGASGSAYVMYGRREGYVAPISISRLDGLLGFRIYSERSKSFGSSVSGAGDINRDGFKDILIGEPKITFDGVFEAGCAYVLYGRAEKFVSPVSLLELNSSSGFKVIGDLRRQLGGSVSGVNDVNGDEIADILMGSHGSQYNEYYLTSVVVFGTAKSSSMNSTSFLQPSSVSKPNLLPLPSPSPLPNPMLQPIPLLPSDDDVVLLPSSDSPSSGFSTLSLDDDLLKAVKTVFGVLLGIAGILVPCWVAFRVSNDSSQQMRDSTKDVTDEIRDSTRDITTAIYRVADVLQRNKPREEQYHSDNIFDEEYEFVDGRQGSDDDVDNFNSDALSIAAMIDPESSSMFVNFSSDEDSPDREVSIPDLLLPQFILAAEQ